MAAYLNLGLELLLQPGIFLIHFFNALPSALTGWLTAGNPVRPGGWLAGLLSGSYWLAVSAIAHRIYGYALWMYRNIRTRLHGFSATIQRLLRVQRIRAKCRATLFSHLQSPDASIRMEPVELDATADAILKFMAGKCAAPVDTATLRQATQTSKHKLKHALAELEQLELLQRTSDAHTSQPVYVLTPGGQLYVKVSA